MKCVVLLLAYYLFLSISIHSQQYGNGLNNLPIPPPPANVSIFTAEDLFDEIKLECRKSKIIYIKDVYECFSSYRNIYRVGCKRPTLESKDGHFIAFFDIQPPLKHQRVDTTTIPYLRGIRADLAMSLGKRIDDIPLEKVEEYIEYKSPDYAKNVFNADRALTYPLSRGEEFFREKYNHCHVLLIYKENVGYFSLYCFYTDRGYKKRNKYNRELERMLKFKDDVNDEIET